MRLIDADALKELFSEVIGHIAKKPEMNGNLEHMIRASAMVIQMIDDAPTVQPDTTTHDSIPAETGKNDGDGTSGDCISRQAAIDKITKRLFETAFNNVGIKQDIDETLVDVAENRLENWFNELPSAQPEHKTGHWILDRSGAYCCNRCMEPCASYVMMKPRDKFCRMCGSRNEVTE